MSAKRAALVATLRSERLEYQDLGLVTVRGQLFKGAPIDELLEKNRLVINKASLRILPTVKLIHKQRMADFERFGEAVSRALGLAPGDFQHQYAELIRAGIDRALESNVVKQVLDKFFPVPKERTEDENPEGFMRFSPAC